MTTQETSKLFRLLDSLHLKSPPSSKRAEIILAWSLALEPYEYEEVKEAALIRARKCRFFPDNVAEILDYLPSNVSIPVTSSGGERWGTVGPEMMDFLDRFRAAREAFKQRLEQAGIPEAPEYHNRQAYEEWVKTVQAAGIDPFWWRGV